MYCLDKHFFIDALSSAKEPGFRFFGQFCQFLYSMLQHLVPGASLPAVEHWDEYLDFSFTTTNVVSVDDFLPGSVLREVLQRCKVATPTKFLELVMAFLRSFIQLLLGHSITKSRLLRGLSSFDPAILSQSTEEVYIESITALTNSLMASGWIAPGDRDLTIGEYRGYLLLVRETNTIFSEDFVAELLSDWRFQARPLLVRVFKLAYLCSYKIEVPEPDVVFNLPGMGMSRIHMVSLLNCLGSSCAYLANPENLFSSDSSLLHLRSLLDSRETIYTQRGYSIWDSLCLRNRSQLYSRLRRSNALYDPGQIPVAEPVQGSSKVVPEVSPRKSSVGFSLPPRRERSGSQSSRKRSRSRSKSPQEDPNFASVVFQPHAAPKGNFKKNKPSS